MHNKQGNHQTLFSLTNCDNCNHFHSINVGITWGEEGGEDVSCKNESTSCCHDGKHQHKRRPKTDEGWDPTETLHDIPTNKQK